MSGLAFTPRTLRRFWSKVDKSAGPDGCWPFTGARNHADYGVIWVAGEHGPANWIASRFAYAVEVADPGENRVCHRCDNPPCCNPAHLFEGTQGDNLIDMRTKGRGSPPPVSRGSRNPSAKLTPDAVLAIRAARRDGVPIKALAAANDVSVATIKRAASGRNWGHVSEGAA